MSFTKIRNTKFNNVIRINQDCFIDSKDHIKFFNAHEKDFEDFKVDENLNSQQVFIVMSE